MGYFTVKVTPDLIDGDVSKLVGNTVGADSGDVAFGAEDILFDWTSFDVPKGTCALHSITMYMMGEDGGAQADADLWLMFAKSVDGTAPGTLGEENLSQTGCFDLPKFLIGSCKIEATGGGAGQLKGPAFGNIIHKGIAGSNGDIAPIIIEGEPDSGTNVGYDKIYVAAFTGAGVDFSTGCKPSAQSTTSTDTIAVDGVDPRKCFQIGDTVYTNTDDTALGTVKSMGANSIVLNANLAAQVEDNEEIVNANPIKIVFGLER